MSKTSIVAAGLLLLSTTGFAGEPAVKAHAQNPPAPQSRDTGHRASDKSASATAANRHGDAVVHYTIQQAKPEFTDPLAAVRAGLRQPSVPPHYYVVAHPAPARPSQSAGESSESLPLIYTPSTKGR